MRIKVIKSADGLLRSMVNLGQAVVSSKWEAMLKRISGQWFQVETDYIFATSFNTAPFEGMPNGIKIEWRFVETIDYEGDTRLERIQKAMQSGQLRCHSFNNLKGEFVDLGKDDKTQQLAKDVLA